MPVLITLCRNLESCLPVSAQPGNARSVLPDDQRPGFLLLKPIGECIDHFFESAEISGANGYDQRHERTVRNERLLLPNVN